MPFSNVTIDIQLGVADLCVGVPRIEFDYIDQL
jgi:hypothetical protein